MCTGRAPFSYRMEELDVFDGIPKIYSDRLRKCIAACIAFHPEDRHDAFDLLRVAQRARNDPTMRHLVPAPVLTSAPIVSMEERDFNSKMISELPLTNLDGRTLDDIPRIVTTEQAKEQTPNADQHTATQLITTPATPAANIEYGHAPMLSEQALDQEELVKRAEAMLLKEKEERQARDDAREAQLKAEAAAAEAKAEREASDARIAEEAASKAAAAAKAEVEKAAAAHAEKAAKEAEIKLKEKEELLAKAKSEAEEAAKKAAAAAAEAEEARKAAIPPPPPEERKAPVRFHDAIGRKFNFPFHLCTNWAVSNP
jgi:hypothetical protein